MYYIVPYARVQGRPGGYYDSVNPEIGLSDATSLMLIFGMSQGAGSLLLGVLATRVNYYWMYLVCCAGSAAVNIATPFTHSFAGLAVLAAALGVLSSGSRLCFPSMVAGMFMGPALGAMMGITLMGYGIGALPAPPVCSVIINAQGGDYTTAMCLMGGTVLLSGLLAFFGMQRFAEPKSRGNEECDATRGLLQGGETDNESLSTAGRYAH
jgi:MFS family permease